MLKRNIEFPEDKFMSQTSEKRVEVCKSTFLREESSDGFAEQIVDTPALPDVKEHVSQIFSQDTVQQPGS